MRWRGPALVLLLGVVAFALLLPFDGLVYGLIDERLEPRGELQRELESIQQYGQGLSALIIFACIWCLDPGRRRRLLDGALALGVASLSCFLIKVMAGRARPFMDGGPYAFSGPLGMFDPGKGRAAITAWPFSSAHSSDMLSMPSSHTAAAAAMSVFLALLYPRIRPLVTVLTVVVGLGRILFTAHFPSDVALGAAVGAASGLLVVRNFLGVRVLDGVWRRFVDRGAVPAFPAAYRRERALLRASR